MSGILILIIVLAVAVALGVALAPYVLPILGIVGVIAGIVGFVAVVPALFNSLFPPHTAPARGDDATEPQNRELAATQFREAAANMRRQYETALKDGVPPGAAERIYRMQQRELERLYGRDASEGADGSQRGT